MTILAKRARVRTFVVLLGVMFVFVGAIAGFAAAPVVDADGFDIDGNLTDDSPIDDWESSLDGVTGNPVGDFFGPGVVSDEIYSIGGLTDTTVFKGGNKFLAPEAWTVISKGGGSSQNDFSNAYITAKNNTDGDPILYIAFERLKKEGDFHLDVEINRSDPVNGAPVRSAGDVAVIFDITRAPTSGAHLSFQVIQFTSTSTFDVIADIDQTGGTNLQQQYADDGVVALMNQDDITGSFEWVPPGFQPDQPWDADKTLGEFTFTEMAIDLGELGITPGCPGLAWVHLKSRASDAVNANLVDLVGPVPLDLSTCATKTFNLDVTPGHIEGLRYFAVIDGHTLDNPSDADGIGDLNGVGPYELVADGTHDFSFTIDPIAPGDLDYHFEVRAADGTTVLLDSPTQSETIGPYDDFVNNATFDYDLVIDDDEVNELGEAETFSATLTGEICGPDFAADASIPGLVDANACDEDVLPGIDVEFDVQFSITEVGTSVLPATSPAITDSAGQVDITVDSDTTAQVATISVWIDSSGGTSGVFDSGEATDSTTKTWVDAQIDVSPLTATNEVDDAHTVTATVQQDDGLVPPAGDAVDGWASAPDGTLVTFSLENNTAGAAFVGAVSTCLTSGGACSVDINTSTPGSVDIHATTTFSVVGESVTRATGTGGLNSADANKVYVDAQIDVSPLTATNEVDDAHTVTATVQQDDGLVPPAGDAVDGWASAPDGTLVTFSLKNNTAGAAFVGAVSTCLTSGGACSVDINTSTPGSVDIHATTTFSVVGESVTRATGTGGLNSADANKVYVDAQIDVSPLTATNEVDDAHTVTATVQQDDGLVPPAGDAVDGWASAPDGTLVTFSLENNTAGAAFVGAVSTCLTSGGACSVDINTSTPGSVDIHATTTFSVVGESVTRATGTGGLNSADANKVYVDAQIDVSPLTDTNEVDDAHTVTATVQQDDGLVPPAGDAVDGWASAPDGTLVTFSLKNNTAGAAFVGAVSTCLTSGGACSVDINTSTPGSVDIHATTTFSVVGESVTRATGTGGLNSADANKVYVDAQIDVSPLTATNEVDDAHTVTATVQQDDGLVPPAGDAVDGWASAPDGTLVTFSLKNNTAGAAFVGAVSTCLTSGGACSVDINTSTPGSVDIHATTTFSVVGESVTRATGTGGLNSADANKVYVDAQIDVSPLTATNEVDDAHTVTATVQQDDGLVPPAGDAVDGWASAPDGTLVTFSLKNNTAGAAFVGAVSTCLTSGGACSVDINTSTPGSVDIHATTTFSVVGESVTRATGTGGLNSADANKVYVDAQIDVSPLTATNEVDDAHTVTATVQQDDGLVPPAGDAVDGWASAPDGTLVTFSLENNTAGAAFVGAVSTCLTSGGACSVDINTSTPGSVDIHATTTFSVVGESVTRATGTGGLNSADANKVYVDAQIDVSPLTDTNGISEAHTVTATVQQDDGLVPPAGDAVDGWASAPDGTLVTFSLENNTAGAAFVGAVSTCLTSGGACSVDINTSTPGSVDIHATTTFSVVGESVTRATGTGGLNSADANKVYVAGELRWLKVDGSTNLPLFGATFEACRTHDRFGATVTESCTTVTDNDATDADGRDGYFKLTNLTLGSWTLQETVAPVGYTFDNAVRGPYVLDLGTLVVDLTINSDNWWRNYPPDEGLTPGFWQGGAGLPLWDDVTDPLAIAVGEALDAEGYGSGDPFYAYAQYSDFFGSSETRTLLEIVGIGGGSEFENKAKRDKIAALLNAVDVEVNYPHSVKTIVDDFFVNLTFEDFHTKYAAANELGVN